MGKMLAAWPAHTCRAHRLRASGAHDRADPAEPAVCRDSESGPHGDHTEQAAAERRDSGLSLAVTTHLRAMSTP